MTPTKHPSNRTDLARLGNAPILHHYWGSPYAEKVRLYLGYKNLPWRSREIAVTPPRPSLAAVLGAFRRTPVLQIGADYVCDTRLILEAIDAVSADGSNRIADSALSDFLCGWAEPRMFALLGAVRFQSAADVDGVFGGAVTVQQFSADRLPFMQPAYEPTRFPLLGDPARDHLRRYLAVLDKVLSTGAPFLGGTAPVHGDFSAYHTIWWLRSPPAHPEMLAAHPRVEQWADRLAAFGHGRFAPISDDETLADARDAADESPAFRPDWPRAEDDRFGHEVEIVADDYGRAPIVGRVIAMTDRHVTIERDSERAGRVRVHFPRLGYEIVRR